MGNIEIIGADLKSDMFLNVNYEVKDLNRKTKRTDKCDAPIHEDLRNAFNKLIPHYLLLTETKKKPELVKDIDLEKEVPEHLLKMFKITGFSLEDKSGEVSVQISGYRKLKNGKRVAFQTPKTNRGTKDDEYEFYNKLMQCIDDLKEEVFEYIDGKQAERMQKSIDFDNDAEGFEPENEPGIHVANKEDFVAA